MPISIYPPILKSTQPAFLASTISYRVYFTLQNITAFEEIGHIQIRVVRQANNKSIINTAQYPDGTIYLAPQDIGIENSQYYVPIDSSKLIEKWQPGYLYKIQMRFGTTPKWDKVSDFASWKQEQIDKQTFSEWSTVMVIKAIDEPNVYIKNAESIADDVISSERTEATLTPELYGGFDITTVSKEFIDKYKFDLYEGKEVDISNLIETSGWLQHNSKRDDPTNNTYEFISTFDVHRFKTRLVNNSYYTVVYSIQTTNGYETTANTPYTFLATRTYLAALEGIIFEADDNSIYAKENGCIQLYCSSEIPMSGSYVITRTDEKSNYEVWEDLKFITISNKQLDHENIFNDFTIESGIKYKYSIQQENAVGLRTQPLYPDDNRQYMINFEYSYIYRDDVQLCLQFDQKMSSFKHTTLRAKQDVIGDKYAHLVQNGHAYYAEFPVTGIISFHMDNYQTFFKLGNEGYYYKDELVIPLDKFKDTGGKRDSNNNVLPTDDKPNISFDLIADNVFVERKFREKAEEFLNDFDYKLYKSPTEGNIVVGLMNMSLTPNEQLGRIIYSFSATAYEVVENTMENLDQYGIINIGQFTSLATDEVTRSFGQVKGIYGVGVNIYDLIRQQEEISIGGGYRTKLKKITDIWVEGYPDIDFTAKFLELEAKKVELLDEDKDTKEIDKQVDEYRKLKAALREPQSVVVRLNINGTTILVMPNKIYSLKEGMSSLTLASSVTPIIVNYVCELTQVQDASVGVITAVDASRIWGQISGVFTGTDKVLKNYNFNYKDSPTYRIYNYRPDASVIYDSQGRTLVDNTNFNVYKVLNILDIIKQETQRQVEYNYNTKFEYIDDEWTDGTIYYQFEELAVVDIEADEGTTFLISSHADGSNPTEIKIGSTCRYILNPLDGQIKFLALRQPQFCVINYKCFTTQTKMTRVGE